MVEVNFPSEWNLVKLGDVVTDDRYSFTGGPFGSDLKSSEYTDEGVRIIQLQNIGVGAFLDKYKIYTTEEKADELITSNIYPGEIIIAKMAHPVARACFIPEVDARYIMASDGIRLVVDEDQFDKRFVLQNINSTYFNKIAESNSTGTTRLRIGLKDLRALPFVKPPLPEQKKIANILSTVDEAIQNTKAQIEKTKELKRGLMQKLFSEGIKGNTVARLKEVAKVIDCKHRTPKYIPKGVPVFSPGTIKWGEIDYNIPTKRVSEEEYISLMDHCVIEVGDLIMSRNQSIGVASIILEKKPCVLGQDTVLIQSKDINSKYLFQYLQSNYMQKQIYKVSGGSTFARINLGAIRKLKIEFPSVENQIRIASVLFDVDSKVDKEVEILNSLKSLKKGLMQKLLTGELRVKL